MIKALRLLALFALAAMAAAPVVRAEDQAPPAEGRKKGGRGQQMSPDEQVARIEQAVGTLTDAQKTKIKDIIAKSREEMQAVPQDQRREKMGEMMQAQRAKIRDVLTADQQKKFDEMPAQGRGKKKA